MLLQIREIFPFKKYVRVRISIFSTKTSNGFNFAKPAFFIWEGVTQYISQDAVTNTPTSISETAPGSEIVFTYILKSVIEKESDIEGAYARVI